MPEEYKSKVYIQIDENNNITRCEGGYSISNISNINDWILIDEGEGDKYNLCQSHYFEGGLLDENNCHKYKYENEETRLSTAEELAEELASFPLPAPTEIEQMRADLDYLLMMEE